MGRRTRGGGVLTQKGAIAQHPDSGSNTHSGNSRGRRWLNGRWVVETLDRRCPCGALIPPRIGKGAPFKYCEAHAPSNRKAVADWYHTHATDIREYQRRRHGYRPKSAYLCISCGRQTRGYVDDRCVACRTKERARERRGAEDRPITCAGCERQLTVHNRTQRFCSRACNKRAWGHRPRPGKHIRQRVLARDNWTCYLCAGPIDPSLAWPHPLGASVDHYIPVSAGGTDRDDNLRATHWHCNENKGDRLPEVEIWIPA